MASVSVDHNQNMGCLLLTETRIVAIMISKEVETYAQNNLKYVDSTRMSHLFLSSAVYLFTADKTKFAEKPQKRTWICGSTAKALSILRKYRQSSVDIAEVPPILYRCCVNTAEALTIKAGQITVNDYRNLASSADNVAENPALSIRFTA